MTRDGAPSSGGPALAKMDKRQTHISDSLAVAIHQSAGDDAAKLRPLLAVSRHGRSQQDGVLHYPRAVCKQDGVKHDVCTVGSNEHFGVYTRCQPGIQASGVSRVGLSRAVANGPVGPAMAGPIIEPAIFFLN